MFEKYFLAPMCQLLSRKDHESQVFITYKLHANFTRYFAHAMSEYRKV